MDLPDHRPPTPAPDPVPAFVRERRAARVADLRRRLEALLPGSGRVVLEFGCGHGHWLTGYAEANPETCCVGIDLLSARIRKAQAKRDKREQENLHFLKAEAMELLEAWPSGRPLNDVFMLFPDPWPKKRHHKNRMIQPDLLDAVAARTVPGGRFHFRTDDEPYFRWAGEHFEAHPEWVLDPDAVWPWETATYFQKLMASWSSLVAVRR